MRRRGNEALIALFEHYRAVSNKHLNPVFLQKSKSEHITKLSNQYISRVNNDMLSNVAAIRRESLRESRVLMADSLGSTIDILAP